MDSVHEGTITEMTDKGAVVSLGENVEGFAPMRQLVKEDGTTATVGEKLPFKVIEFSKATKRITLSHTRLSKRLNVPSGPSRLPRRRLPPRLPSLR